MASVRKRGNSYLLVVSMGYDYQGNRIKAQQKTVKPPDGLTPKQTEKWLNEQAILFEKQAKNQPVTTNKNITLAQYIAIWQACSVTRKSAPRWIFTAMPLIRIGKRQVMSCKRDWGCKQIWSNQQANAHNLSLLQHNTILSLTY